MTEHDTGHEPVGSIRYENYARRLARLRVIRGIKRMVESDTYCIDVLTQIAGIKPPLAVKPDRPYNHCYRCRSPGMK